MLQPLTPALAQRITNNAAQVTVTRLVAAIANARCLPHAFRACSAALHTDDTPLPSLRFFWPWQAVANAGCMMKLILMFIPLIWLGQNIQNELLLEDGQFNYDRFWNPDAKAKSGDYHVWCWGNAALKFSDQDVVQLINGVVPPYTPVTTEDMGLCQSALMSSN